MENIVFKKLNHFPAGCNSETLSDVFWRNMYSHKPGRQNMVERTHSHLSHWWASLPPTWGDSAGKSGEIMLEIQALDLASWALYSSGETKQ